MYEKDRNCEDERKKDIIVKSFLISKIGSK